MDHHIEPVWVVNELKSLLFGRKPHPMSFLLHQKFHLFLQSSICFFWNLSEYTGVFPCIIGWIDKSTDFFSQIGFCKILRLLNWSSIKTFSLFQIILHQDLVLGFVGWSPVSNSLHACHPKPTSDSWPSTISWQLFRFLKVNRRTWSAVFHPLFRQNPRKCWLNFFWNIICKNIFEVRALRPEFSPVCCAVLCCAVLCQKLWLCCASCAVPVVVSFLALSLCNFNFL